MLPSVNTDGEQRLVCAGSEKGAAAFIDGDLKALIGKPVGQWRAPGAWLDKR